jgi:hypothetical protein
MRLYLQKWHGRSAIGFCYGYWFEQIISSLYPAEKILVEIGSMLLYPQLVVVSDLKSIPEFYP